MRIQTVLVALVAAAVAGGAMTFYGVVTNQRVGDETPAGTVLPTGKAVRPLGVTAMLTSAPSDAAPIDNGEMLVKTSSGVTRVHLPDGTIVADLRIRGGTSLTGLVVMPSRAAGATADAVVSTAGSDLVLLSTGSGGLKELGRIRLPPARVGGACYPCGLAAPDAGTVVAALNRDNSMAVVDIASKKVTRSIPVDPAPYAVAVEGGIAWVSCWSRPLKPGEASAPSSGTPVPVDARGIGTGGTVCRVDLRSGRILARALVSGQPTEIVVTRGAKGKPESLFVACSNGDEVFQLNPTTLEVTGYTPVANAAGLDPAGAAPNSIAVSDGVLYVACGGENKVFSYELGTGNRIGIMPTAWYPSVVRATPDGVMVACAKGIGSRAGTSPRRMAGEITGTVSWVGIGQTRGYPPNEPDTQSRSKLPKALTHVVYVIKENRTYDQVLGDMKEGNGDPNLVMYGENVTPNQHALARQFVLLDNYYCNGLISSDGHAWATEGNATTYYERARGGWTRSYPFGDDPLATSATGYIWDDALAHHRSVWNFGEFDYATPIGETDPLKILADFKAGRPFTFRQNIGVARLRALSQPDFPGWNLAIPDVLRADRFIHRLREDEKRGQMADLTILYLPQDHTSGGAGGYPSPRAQVADNDLAVGQCIDALSHSRFWPSTVVFVTEDDPQDGYDHVDGHRSPCLVVSPYTRRGITVSHLYNQTSVLRTIEQVLGLPPMNRNDAEASSMSAFFRATPDLTPFVALPNRIPLDEKPPAHTETAFRLDRPDANDDEAFNRALWRLAGKPLSALPVRYR